MKKLTRKEVCARYRERHRERVRAAQKKWRDENPEKQLAATRAWQEAHWEQYLGTLAAWKRANPEKTRAANEMRRARKRGAPTDGHSTAELVAHTAWLGGKCMYCFGPYETLDHVEPLSKGGAHALDNIVPACMSCNTSKGAKPLLIWLLSRT